MAEMPVKQNADEEIDLFDLVDDVVDKWYWLVGALVAGVVVAALYAFIAVPVYKTQAVVTQSSSSGLLPFSQPALQTSITLVRSEGKTSGAEVQISDEAVFEISNATAFAGARAVLRSVAARRAFYQELLAVVDSDIRTLLYNETLTEEQNFSEFLRRFGFTDPGAKGNQDIYIEVAFELAADPVAARDILNSYVEFSLNLYTEQVKSELERKVDAQLKLNRGWADNFRIIYESEKVRRIALLEEAAAVAGSIGQDKPFYNTNDVVVSSEPPLYMMGQRALQKEADQLRARAENGREDLFIEGLPVIESYIESLESLSIDWDSVQMVEIDQPALLPIKAVKPKKALIIALGGVGGLMLGVLAALLAAASGRHKRRSER
ncbi:MAG: Wzz/FepE/Etk N-terminal domain-containing protein [Thalassolituus sp.]